MNAIIGFSELLNNPRLTAEKRRYFTDMISQGSNQLLSIINDIITISAIEAGQEQIYESKQG
jgi:two-component system sensor histidine kinase EvgS